MTLYIAITGVIFALLLSGLQESLDTHIGWVNFALHKLLPIVVVADWLLDPPRHRLPLRVAAAWLCYPAAWFVYTLVRGASVDWYPYPFVDVSRHGYDGVFLSSAFLLVGFVGASVAFVLIGNRRAAGQAGERLSSAVPGRFVSRCAERVRAPWHCSVARIAQRSWRRHRGLSRCRDPRAARGLHVGVRRRRHHLKAYWDSYAYVA